MGREDLAQKNYSHAALEFKIAARNLPNSAEPLYQLGLVYLEVGDVNSAVAALMQATKVDPKHADSQIKLAQLMALNQDPEAVREAERRARAVMATSQGNADAIATLALAEMRLGEKRSAEEHLQDGLARFPNSLKSSVLLAMLKAEKKDFDGAEKVLRDAIRQSPRSPEPLVALGRFYEMWNRPLEAEAAIQSALKLDPKNSEALLDLAAYQVERGQTGEAEQTYKRLAALDDKQFRSVHAVYVFQAGQRDQGLAELVRLHRDDPKDRTVRTQLIAAYLATKRVNDAEHVLTEALKKNPRDTDALLQRSEIYLLAGKATEAQNDLNQVLGYRPDSAQAHFVLARVYLLQGSQLNQRRELTEALKLDPSLLAARVDLAQSYIGANDAKAAVDLMRQTPAGQSNSILAIVQLNWALWAVGNLPELQKGIERGLNAGGAPDLTLQLALLKLQAKDLKTARELLARVLKDNPEDLRALEVLARSYAADNQPAAAIAAVRQYAALRPKSPVMQQFLGMWLAGSGNRDEARTAFETAKSADPSYVGADFALAQLDLSEGKVDTARQRLSGVLDSNPKNLDAKLLLGMVEELGGRIDVAINQYRKVLDAEPSNLYALNNIAYCLTKNGNQADEALKYAQRAIEVSPENPAVQDTVGWAYYQKGFYRDAVQYLTNAVAGGTVPVRMYHLAMAFEKAGKTSQAKHTYEAALKLNPNIPEAQLAARVLHL